MGKGFGFKKMPEVDRLRSRITRIINAGYAGDNNVCVFMTVRKHRDSLSVAVNQLAQLFPLLHFQVIDSKDTLLKVLVSSEVKNTKGLCCVWVEESEFTCKWLVQASPPGSWDYRVVCAWKSKDKALEVANSIYKKIRSMSVNDWRDRTVNYLQFLRDIPDDDDEIIAVSRLGRHYISPQVKAPDILRKRIVEVEHLGT